mmetsp:Transcript_152749/g.470344  ORF Transcript_152749/g.470344 Transcript_152749/m.470344 type:complete len:305 (+) Transcript_152749:81-995(+)
MQALKSSPHGGGVRPFKDAAESEEEEPTPAAAWIGPYHVGCCVVEIHGPLQIVFGALAALASVFLIVELWREGFDTLRFIAGLVFISVCVYLVWLGKAIYLLKAFRKEIEKFRGLNQQLKGEVAKLETQNQSHDSKNKEQRRLNGELSDRVSDLSRVERQLGVLSVECQGSVAQARHVLERLERNVKLNTVNSAFLFFDRADRDRNGRVDGGEVSHFVDSLAFLWCHLPHFDAARVKASIAQQGGISLEQVHKLVDGMMLDPEAGDPAALARRLEGALAGPEASEDELDRSARTISPPVAPRDT